MQAEPAGTRCASRTALLGAPACITPLQCPLPDAQLTLLLLAPHAAPALPQSREPCILHPSGIFLCPSPDAVQGPKQRKAVDRRASKGRKLRYHVHEKLVNFMAPVELAAPQFAAQLFSNLFGGGAAPRA